MSPLVIGLYVVGFLLIGLSYVIRGPRVHSKIRKLQELEKSRARSEEKSKTHISSNQGTNVGEKKEETSHTSLKSSTSSPPLSRPSPSSTSSTSVPSSPPSITVPENSNKEPSGVGVQASEEPAAYVSDEGKSGGKGKGKKKELSPEEKKQRKLEMKQRFKELKEKKKQKELEELERLREENKKRKEEEERRRREKEEEEERRRLEAEAEEQRLIQLKKEEKERKKREEEEEAKKREEEEKERLRREEEERKREEIIKEANKPKPKPAWGGAALQKVEAVSIADLLFKKPVFETEEEKEKKASSSNLERDAFLQPSGEDPAVVKLREERRRHRRLMLEKREREKAQLELFETRTNKSSREKSSAEAESLAQKLLEKMNFSDEGISLTIDRNGNGNVSGVPESTHALLIGEGGGNVAVLKALGLRVSVNGPLIKLEGYHEDIDLGYSKIKLVVRWKQILDAAKSAMEAKAHCTEAGLVTEAHAQQIIHDRLRLQAAELCYVFHNEVRAEIEIGFGKCRLDLVGINNESEQMRYFEKRIDEIERCAISALPSNILEVILPIPRNGPPVTQLERDICAYLKDYHFKYEIRSGKGTRIIYVNL